MGAAVLTASDAAWAWPTGVTSLTAEALGGGGDGGNATNNPANCGGGKGGSYAKVVITKGAESALSITVGGAAAASTIMQGASTVLSAAGGASVAANSATGASALVGANTGSTTFAGGNGGTAVGTNTTSGGGGGAAGPGGVGGAGSGGTAGTPETSAFLDGNSYSGTSGAGVAVRNIGNNGVVRGGAGSGGNTNQAADKAGGVGAAGIVVLTWTDPVASDDLTANDLDAGTPTLGTPATGQEHALGATDLSAGTPTLGSPSLAEAGESDDLTANDLDAGAPTLGAPAIGQVHALGADALDAGTPTLGSPTLGGEAIPEIAVSVGHPSRQKWRQELVDLLDREAPEDVPTPVMVKRAIARVIGDAPPDDSAAIRALREELARLNLRYRPRYGEAIRRQLDISGAIDKYRAKMDADDEDVAFLMLH